MLFRSGVLTVVCAEPQNAFIARALRLAHERDSAESAALMLELQETLANSFFRLGLSENQEQFNVLNGEEPET